MQKIKVLLLECLDGDAHDYRKTTNKLNLKNNFNQLKPEKTYSKHMIEMFRYASGVRFPAKSYQTVTLSANIVCFNTLCLRMCCYSI